MLTLSPLANNVKLCAILLVVNMTLSKRGDYVVRSALALARAWPGGEPRKIREVVAEMGVPQTFASQILADLVRAGLATSKAGKDGGYRLARSPEEIPLVAVVEAGEGPLRAERCALGEGPCRWDDVCPLHDTWRTATEALRQVLGTTSLADLVARDVAIEEGRAGPPVDPHRHGGASLEVDDWVHVEAGVDVLEAYLHHEERVAALVEAAYEAADALREELLPAGHPWAPAQAFATCSALSAEQVSRGSRGVARAGADRSFRIAWEAVTGDGSTSHAELELAARPVDPERTEIRVAGRLRPPGSGAPEEPDAKLQARLVQVALRALLRNVARELASQLTSPAERSEPRGVKPVTRSRHPRAASAV